MKQYCRALVIGGVISHVAEQDKPFPPGAVISVIDAGTQNRIAATEKSFELESPEDARIRASELLSSLEIGGNGAPKFKDTAPRKKKVVNSRNV